MANSKELLRSGDKNLDLMHLYLTSELYDCSFKVGFEESSIKVFKCHKLILSVDSIVFQQMFNGHFQESNKGPDDPVLLDYVLPEVFDAVMRYIYGSEKKFLDALLAVEVYQFAHAMQLDNLLSDVGKFLEDVDLDNLISVYNLFVLTENQQGLKNCRKKISHSTDLVLDSSCWLSATKETIEDVLGLEDLGASESDLFKAIIRWGEAQIYARENQTSNDDELRAMVDSCIKLIRFMSMDIQEFGELCDLRNVLRHEEQDSIFLSIGKNDSDYMPENFNRSSLSRHKNLSQAIICNTNYTCSGTRQNTSLKFSVSNVATLLGLEIDINLNSAHSKKGVPIFFPHSSSGFENIEIIVSNRRGVKVASGNTSNTRRFKDRIIVLVSPPTKLEVGHQYSISFSSTPAPHYLFEIMNLNTSDSLINSTDKEQTRDEQQHLQNSKQSTNPSSSKFPPAEITSKKPNSMMYNLGLLAQRLTASNYERVSSVLQENIINLQIHDKFASAPIIGFIFNPQQ